jgi:hypothetical protein
VAEDRGGGFDFGSMGKRSKRPSVPNDVIKRFCFYGNPTELGAAAISMQRRSTGDAEVAKLRCPFEIKMVSQVP